MRPKDKKDQPSEERTGKGIPGGKNYVYKGPVAESASRESKRQGRREGAEAGNGQELDYTGLREESAADLGIKEKPESPQLQESRGEVNDQFILKRTFSGPRA